VPVTDFLPPGLRPDQALACVAIVSDTHMPRRCRSFPPRLFDLLAGATLLIHAGDVGELWVLDQLSAMAPVLAVHGNDETPEAQRHLPYELVTAVQGERIFVWHSHLPDWREEQAARQGDEILPKLQRTVERATQAGARLAIFGHWHIPLVHRTGNLTVVNPGAIASGNEITRQMHQTVALAWRTDGPEPWQIVHVEVTDTPQRWDATVTWEDGFEKVGSRYQASILDPTLRAQLPALLAALEPAQIATLRDLVLAQAHRVWAGELPLLTRDQILADALAARLFSEADLTRLFQATDTGAA
jgi:putative phosphoesterase